MAVGAAAGWESSDPAVLQMTNNVIVWLKPHPVVAKVGTWLHSAANLGREALVCTSLDARIARPLSPEVRTHEPTGFAVTLWEHLDALPFETPNPGQLAVLIGTVHGALRHLEIELPPLSYSLELTRTTLFDDDAMQLLPVEDRAFVRAQFDTLVGQLDDFDSPERPLHGEPHLGNVIVTPTGPHLVDFESVCTGPLEWDLASVPPAVAACFANVDHDLLALTRLINRARVVTWCWNLADFPDMRDHGELHLRLLRRDAPPLE